MIKKYAAFSLVEMLMALLVASLLLAALAPVITKRFGGELINFEGIVQNPSRHKVVYLTEPNEGEWTLPDGIRTFKVTTVAAGGGGGAGSNYGCVVFTTTATPTASLLGDDAKYCEHVRGDGNINFALPDAVNEIYVSMISAAGGGAGGFGTGQLLLSRTVPVEAKIFNFNVPAAALGDRVVVNVMGAGGGGGGADQGGGGGGAAGGHVLSKLYDIAINETIIPVIVGAGGKGGYYYHTPGAGGAGYQNGESGAANTGGGGGGGSSSFGNQGKVIVARGGGGGAGQTYSSEGWASPKFGGMAAETWKKCFNYGGEGRYGGRSGGPDCIYNGIVYNIPSGGNGGEGDDGRTGRSGQDGTVGENGTAFGSERGGGGGVINNSLGNGGKGQDYGARYNANYDSPTVAGGGAGGGGGSGIWGTGGTSALTYCRGPFSSSKLPIAKAGQTSGGAGASCGWNTGGAQYGGEGGDGIVQGRYLVNLFGGSAGQSGHVVPRSKISYTNAMKAGSIITINLGKGGAGGDRFVISAYVNELSQYEKYIRTMRGSVVNEDTSFVNANGKPGTTSTISFNNTVLAKTGDAGSCGGGYQTTDVYKANCTGTQSCGTFAMNGACINRVAGWHGHQSGVCNSVNGNSPKGTSNEGGIPTILEWDGQSICGPTGGTLGIGSDFSKRNGVDGSAGFGGSGAYYGGYGGKGGDGYVKIEWGIPRNIDRTDALRYSGGGGSAGETVTKRITVSPTVNKIKYKIGKGGEGAVFDINNNKMNDGGNGGDTIFGIGATAANSGFNSIISKGGIGGKSVKITSAIDSNSIITALSGIFGSGGTAKCNVDNNCNENMNGLTGENNKGGKGGSSSTGTGAEGGSSNNNLNGNDAINLQGNGINGGGAGGGGGASGNNAYGKGGKGANGYIKIEYDD